jgi:hypothetical protein
MAVHPAWRKKDQEVRREHAGLLRQQAPFGALILPAPAEPAAAAACEQKKGQ